MWTCLPPAVNTAKFGTLIAWKTAPLHSRNHRYRGLSQLTKGMCSHMHNRPRYVQPQFNFMRRLVCRVKEESVNWRCCSRRTPKSWHTWMNRWDQQSRCLIMSHVYVCFCVCVCVCVCVYMYICIYSRIYYACKPLVQTSAVTWDTGSRLRAYKALGLSTFEIFEPRVLCRAFMMAKCACAGAEGGRNETASLAAAWGRSCRRAEQTEREGAIEERIHRGILLSFRFHAFFFSK